MFIFLFLREKSFMLLELMAHHLPKANKEHRKENKKKITNNNKKIVSKRDCFRFYFKQIKLGIIQFSLIHFFFCCLYINVVCSSNECESNTEHIK